MHWTPYGRVVFCMSELWKKCSHVSEQQEQGQLVAESGDSTGWAVATTLAGQSPTAPGLDEQSWKVKATTGSKVIPGNLNMNSGTELGTGTAMTQLALGPEAWA